MRCEEDVGGVGTLPFVFPPVDGLGTLAALVEALGKPSFCTIFACISSSLEALTCLGQNNVTKLHEITSQTNIMTTLAGDRDGNEMDAIMAVMTYVQRWRLQRSTSSPAARLFSRTWSIRRPIAARDSFNMATLLSLGISPPDNLSCF